MEEAPRGELLVKTIYHTNHIEGDPLSLAEVRAIVDDYWRTKKGQAGDR